MLMKYRKVHTNGDYTKIFPIMLTFLIILELLPFYIHAVDTTIRTISGTITYTSGTAPEGGINLRVFAMGNGYCAVANVTIPEGKSTVNYSLTIDLSETNGSTSFTVKCSPLNEKYSQSTYSSLVDISTASVTDINLTIEMISFRTISGTITYTSGTAPTGGINMTVLAIGNGCSAAIDVTIPEGGSITNYCIPINLSVMDGCTSFTIKCSPSSGKYCESIYASIVSVNTGSVSDINMDVHDVPIIKGDLNGDGIIDAGDAVLIIRYADEQIYLTDVQKEAGRITKDTDTGLIDDSIDYLDAIQILRYDAGLDSMLDER